jgi:hypothetical protein
MSSIIELPSLYHPDAWDEPILFDDFNTPKIPASLLPGIFGEFVKALSVSLETPEALSVMIILGVISTAISQYCKVSPKEGWEEAVNIYTLIALPPANHKSIVLKTCTKPLVEWEKQQEALYKVKIKRQFSERKTQEKVIEVLRAKAAKTEDLLQQQKLMQEIIEKELALEELSVTPQLFTNDVTPESLITLLNEQKGRLAIFSDEGGILETLGGLYNNGIANVDVLLKGIDGGDIRVRRKDKNISLNPYLTLVLAVQPIIIQNLISKQAYTGNGMIERFLYVLPQSQLGYRTHDNPVLPQHLQSAYHSKVTALLNEVKSEIIFKLAPEAFSLWKQFQKEIEIELRANGRLGSCQGWAGKICGYALRIAGLLHVAEFGIQKENISFNTMVNALQLSRLLIDHALVAFNLMGDDEATEDAKWIWQWILSKQKSPVTQSELLLGTHNKKLGRVERLNKALQVLRNRNLISQPIKLPTRKPTTVYYIHPLALQDN